MFGWLKRKVQISSLNAIEEDLDRFLLGLKGSDSSELGLIVAVASHWRNRLETEFGWNLDYPDTVEAQDPTAPLKLVKMIRQNQMGRNDPMNLMAAGLMVWIHTLRASARPELRLKGREMWGELCRGIPHADSAVSIIAQHHGLHIDAHGAERVPDNLQPVLR